MWLRRLVCLESLGFDEPVPLPKLNLKNPASHWNETGHPRNQGTGKTGGDAPLIAAGSGVWMYNDVGGLGAICPLHNFKLDRVTFLQGSITFSYNRCVMDKDIRTGIAPYETVPL